MDFEFQCLIGVLKSIGFKLTNKLGSSVSFIGVLMIGEWYLAVDSATFLRNLSSFFFSLIS